MDNELTPIRENTELSQVIQDVMSPVLKTLAQMIAQNVKALEELSATQRVTNDRIDALEKQIRLNTPVTPAQVKLLNAETKKRAKELLEGWGNEETGFEPGKNAKCVNKIARHIKQEVLTRYGVSTLNEIPRHEYSVALYQIQSSNDRRYIRDTIREFEV